MSEKCCRVHCSRKGPYQFQDLFFCHQHLQGHESYIRQVRREILEAKAKVLPRDIATISDAVLEVLARNGGLPEILKGVE